VIHNHVSVVSPS